MANIVQIKRSSIPGKQPNVADLQVGELAINLADALLYSKDTTGNIIQIGGSGGSTTFSNTFIGSMASETFTADGSNSDITLSTSPGNEETFLVFVNGVIQQPNVNYSVAGNVITFASTPLSNAKIFVRYFEETNVSATTTNIAEGTNLYYSNARVTSYLSVLDGNIIPNSDNVYSLGSDSNRFKDLFLSGNTLVIGGITLKDTGGVLSIEDPEGNSATISGVTSGGSANLTVISRAAPINLDVTNSILLVIGRSSNVDVTVN